MLRYPAVESVTLVELDPNMTRLFATHETLVRPQRRRRCASPKLKIVNTDAFQWLQQTQEMFDVIVVDFPDPTNFSLGKLYTNAFYALLEQRLAASGYAVVQTTSPLVARQSFWTVVDDDRIGGPEGGAVPRARAQLRRVGLRHRQPPALAPACRTAARPALPRRCDSLPPLFDFPRDMARVPAEVNRLSNQVLVTTYEQEWGKVHP